MFIYTAGTDGFQLIYINGHSTSQCNITLIFQCVPNAKWNDANITTFVEKFTKDECSAYNVVYCTSQLQWGMHVRRLNISIVICRAIHDI